jgi:hypothetical protein
MRASLSSLLSPATITTTVGAAIAIGAGLGDAWLGHAFGVTVDLALVAAGLGALLGHNPVLPSPS